VTAVDASPEAIALNRARMGAAEIHAAVGRDRDVQEYRPLNRCRHGNGWIYRRYMPDETRGGRCPLFQLERLWRDLARVDSTCRRLSLIPLSCSVVA